MIVKADGVKRRGYAMRNVRTGEIALCTVSETSREAGNLLAAARVHRSFDEPHRVARVLITVELERDE